MHTIPADKVHVHVIATVAEFRARREAASQVKRVVMDKDAAQAFIMEGTDEDQEVIILSSVRETVGLSSGPSMREALGLAA
jgi:hypothetical protein